MVTELECGIGTVEEEEQETRVFEVEDGEEEAAKTGGEGEGSEGEVEETVPMKQEVVEPKTLKDPGEPTKLERLRHSLTHLPYKAWCQYCVMGRGRQLAHRRSNKHKGLPVVQWDYT